MFLFESVRFQRSRLEKRRVYERERERGRGRERGGLSSLETSIPIFRGDECRMSTSHARRRFLSANAMKCVSLFSRLFLESICVRGLCVERLSTSSKISGRRMCCRPITEIDSFVRKNDTKMDESNASSNQLPIFFSVLHPFQQRTVVTCYCFSKFECDLNLI